jgi:hypothetical protein
MHHDGTSHMTDSTPRRTGWVVHSQSPFDSGEPDLNAARDDMYLIGSPHDSAIREWWSWGSLKSARIYATQRDAKAAMRGYRKRRGQTIEYLRLR